MDNMELFRELKCYGVKEALKGIIDDPKITKYNDYKEVR